jgi:hypothetical protein
LFGDLRYISHQLILRMRINMNELLRVSSERNPYTEKAKTVSEWISAVDFLLLDEGGLMQAALRPLMTGKDVETGAHRQEIGAALLALRDNLNDLFRKSAEITDSDWHAGQSLLLSSQWHESVENGDDSLPLGCKQ